MANFIWTVVFFYALDGIAKLVLVGTKQYLQPRKPGLILADVTICAAMVVWGAVLLAR